MNITNCPQCGGRVRSVSIGWKCESCQGFIDMRGEFHQHKEEPFMPPTTNADRIRAMTDEELADFIDRCEAAGYNDSSIARDENDNLMDTFDWLQQPAEEDT